MEALYNQVDLVARLKLSEMIKTVSQWYSWQTNKRKINQININLDSQTNNVWKKKVIYILALYLTINIKSILGS